MTFNITILEWKTYLHVQSGEWNQHLLTRLLSGYTEMSWIVSISSENPADTLWLFHCDVDTSWFTFSLSPSTIQRSVYCLRGDRSVCDLIRPHHFSFLSTCFPPLPPRGVYYVSVMSSKCWLETAPRRSCSLLNTGGTALCRTDTGVTHTVDWLQQSGTFTVQGLPLYTWTHKDATIKWKIKVYCFLKH